MRISKHGQTLIREDRYKKGFTVFLFPKAYTLGAGHEQRPMRLCKKSDNSHRHVYKF